MKVPLAAALLVLALAAAIPGRGANYCSGNCPRSGTPTPTWPWGPTNTTTRTVTNTPTP